MVKCFRSSIDTLRDECEGQLHQTAKIPLKLPMESRFDVYPQEWSNGMKVLYAVLRPPLHRSRVSRKRIEFVRVGTAVSKSAEARSEKSNCNRFLNPAVEVSIKNLQSVFIGAYAFFPHAPVILPRYMTIS